MNALTSSAQRRGLNNGIQFLKYQHLQWFKLIV